MGAMKALKEAGVRYRRMYGHRFDDRPEAIAQVPQLTTVHVPLYKSGYQAVEVLLRRINGQTDAVRR